MFTMFDIRIGVNEGIYEMTLDRVNSGVRYLKDNIMMPFSHEQAMNSRHAYSPLAEAYGQSW